VQDEMAIDAQATVAVPCSSDFVRARGPRLVSMWPDSPTSILVNMTSILDILALLRTMPVEAIMDKFRLRNRLKVARAEKDLSQEQLASLAGVTRQTISSIETGQYTPSTLLAMILALRLGQRVEELFFLEETS